jgi:hypothetical protein
MDARDLTVQGPHTFNELVCHAAAPRREIGGEAEAPAKRRDETVRP